MAGLQRFITYIYKYDNDEKMENTGFAKFEIQGNICKIEAHIRNISMEQKETTVYLFARKAEIMQGIPVGTMAVSRGCADVRYAFDVNGLVKFGLTMGEMEGLYLPFENQIYLASQWKEGVIKKENFRILEEKAEKEEKEVRNKEKETEKTQAEPKRKAEEEHTPQPVMEKGGRQDLKILPRQEESRQEEKRGDESGKTERNGEGESGQPIQATELPLEEFFCVNGWDGIFRKLRLKLELLYPFEGQDIECVKMQLGDLRELPKKYWSIGNNSFLLHGFFNYRHIIFGQQEENGKKQYFIGVPGVFQNQERIMATMFGFPDFRTAKTAEYKTGNFGYWYRLF